MAARGPRHTLGLERKILGLWWHSWATKYTTLSHRLLELLNEESFLHHLNQLSQFSVIWSQNILKQWHSFCAAYCLSPNTFNSCQASCLHFCTFSSQPTATGFCSKLPIDTYPWWLNDVHVPESEFHLASQQKQALVATLPHFHETTQFSPTSLSGHLSSLPCRLVLSCLATYCVPPGSVLAPLLISAHAF